MADLETALATQLANIEKRTGKSLAELIAIVKSSGLSKHGQMVSMLKTTLGMGHGDANTMVHMARKSDDQSASEPLSKEQVLDGPYTGRKEALRPIHDKLMVAIRKFGDVEEARKKTYISYRRKKQFATIGAATNTRVEVGLNMKGVPATDKRVDSPRCAS